jgi:hypothetical protein
VNLCFLVVAVQFKCHRFTVPVRFVRLLNRGYPRTIVENVLSEF